MSLLDTIYAEIKRNHPRSRFNLLNWRHIFYHLYTCQFAIRLAAMFYLLYNSGSNNVEVNIRRDRFRTVAYLLGLTDSFNYLSMSFLCISAHFFYYLLYRKSNAQNWSILNELIVVNVDRQAPNLSLHFVNTQRFSLRSFVRNPRLFAQETLIDARRLVHFCSNSNAAVQSFSKRAAVNEYFPNLTHQTRVRFIGVWILAETVLKFGLIIGQCE